MIKAIYTCGKCKTQETTETTGVNADKPKDWESVRLEWRYQNKRSVLLCPACQKELGIHDSSTRCDKPDDFEEQLLNVFIELAERAGVKFEE